MIHGLRHWIVHCRCNSGFGPPHMWSGRTKSASGYGPAGPNTLADMVPGGPYPLAYSVRLRGFGPPPPPHTHTQTHERNGVKRRQPRTLISQGIWHSFSFSLEYFRAVIKYGTGRKKSFYSCMIYVHDDQHDAATWSPENRVRNMTTEADRKATDASNENC